ncbi:SirB2 family protein [Piscinibacter sp.]|jgi:uncharacterized membrane protein SirB2|uniref:SirB2 family protein n=1 Tax=Piscinibacter sp. TaxID=1903157 RepID=UPI00355A783B
MDYATLKIIHQSAVTLSAAGFLARGLAAFSGAAWVRGRLAKTLPHVVDSVLLASAIGLAWMLRLTPAAAPWLSAKIIGLFVYIGLGMLALKPGRPPFVRVIAWVAALVTFAYIVSVAISKDPRGFLIVA